MFTTLILRYIKKKPNTCENISPTFKYLKFIFQTTTNFRSNSSTWNLFFKLPQIVGLIQIFASSLNTHDYNNLIFEVHANKH
jgi:hypothetical protein